MMSHIAASTEEEQLLFDIARCHLSLLAFVSAKGAWKNVAPSLCCIFPAVHLSWCVTLHRRLLGLFQPKESVKPTSPDDEYSGFPPFCVMFPFLECSEYYPERLQLPLPLKKCDF